MKLKKSISAFLAGVLLFLPASYASAEWIKKTGEKEQTQTEEQEAAPAEERFSTEYRAYDDISEFVSEKYIDDTLSKDDIFKKGLSELLSGNKTLLVNLLKAMADSLDDYSEFYTYEEYMEYQSNMNNAFYGIGVTLEKQDQYIVIADFTENSGAKEAGLMIGDKIVEVNGADVTGMEIEEVRNKIIGEINTTVNVTVLRGDSRMEFNIMRSAVNQSTVTGGILVGNIGYVKITSFGNDTASEFANILEFFRGNNVKKIILDLRNNPGGLVIAAVNIAEMIVPKGKIIDVSFREEKYNTTYNSALENKEFDILTLVNENTASSSEILASAIQDSGVGRLIGKKTYGKAVIQQPFALDNGMVLKITIGQYLTRNGNEINKIGLTPDIEIENGLKPIDPSQYTSFDYSTRYSIGQSGDGVKAAKEKLYMLGLYNDSLNGNVYTKPLQDAVKSFQQGHDLVPSGIIDIATQSAIDKAFSQLETTDDLQLEHAYELFGGKASDLY